MSSLPPEIWGLVIDLLPHRDQRTCLFLSKLHHDFAFPNVFSHVTVTLGLWIWRPWISHERIRPSSNEQERMVRQSSITLDFLQAVASRPDLAKVVTQFTVHACTWANSEHNIDQQRLIAALEVLPNLQVFRWYGLHPIPSPAIFEALGAGSLTTLTEIRIPMLEGKDDVLPQIYHFPSLRSLSLIRQGAVGGPGHNTGGVVFGSSSDITIRILTHLSVSGDVMWRRASFSGLRELELIFTISFRLVGFTNILRHCTALTSLTLLPDDLSDPDEVFPVLGAHPNAFPELTAFKYLKPMDADPPTTPQHVAALCEFLKGKRRLRRLDVVLHGDDRDEDPFFELLRSLPALEVLGFDFMRADWLPDDDIAFFQRVLPARLSALRVGQLVLVHDPDLCASYRAEWIKLFKSLTSLRYLHVFENFIEPPETETALRLRQLPIEELPGSLELYGYGLYIQPVVREPPNNPDAGFTSSVAHATLGPCWPIEKVAFRTEEDFGCADWEWLLRWHDYTGLDMLWPGVLPNGPPLMLNPHVPLQVNNSL